VADPEIERLRERLADVDLSIVAAVNRRLLLVEELRKVKDERGIAFLDPAREEWMLGYLTAENDGPLSDEGLRELYTELLALTKRELGR
jgi:3-deoxy-7-phosphoheptulonate synthase/chorismate mutase